MTEPTEVFWSTHYLRHNQRRQEHLASLGLPIAGRVVLEVGAGIGDHTSFFIDRECVVVVTEAQEQNLTVLRDRYPSLDVRQLDLDAPPDEAIEVDVVYCYGTLYHLERPAGAIAWMARCANEMLLLETCVAAGEHDDLYPAFEPPGDPENAVAGRGCRPTRNWVRRELAKHFSHVYVPMTQPWHEEFPLDWSRPELADQALIRAVFVASRQPLANGMLTEELPTRQVHEFTDLDSQDGDAVLDDAQRS
jgi:ubiquinone/menaquinone biosynthesis C-methylase UbiE